ncbi:MAG: class I SAM-dependent DNA methyltransferase [Tepidisphaeraceae bacterium]
MPRSDASRRYHNRVARRYDAIYSDPFWEFHDELTWRRIKPHLPRDLSIACADLGCGTGKWGMRLLKSGFAVTFVDSSPAMIEQSRRNVAEQKHNSTRARFEVADVVRMPQLGADGFGLVLALGDVLSICSDPQRACRELSRIVKPGGIAIATADNKLAALDHYVRLGNLDSLEEFVATGRTSWLTADEREQFELSTFTPGAFAKLFEKSGFEVLELTGKTVLPLRQNKSMLNADDAMQRLLKVEERLSRDPASVGRAAHLQIVAAKR